MTKLDLKTGAKGSIIMDLRTPFPQKSMLGQIVCRLRPDTWGANFRTQH